MPSSRFCPFLSCLCSVSAVRRDRPFHGAASPQRRDLAPPFYLRIVGKAIPFSSFVLLLSSFLPTSARSSFFSTYSHTSLTLFCCCHSLSCSLSFFPFRENCPSPSLFPMLATPYPLSADNDYYRLIRVCILTRIQSATRSAGTRGEEGARSQATARGEMHFLRQYLERF